MANQQQPSEENENNAPPPALPITGGLMGGIVVAETEQKAAGGQSTFTALANQATSWVNRAASTVEGVTRGLFDYAQRVAPSSWRSHIRNAGTWALRQEDSLRTTIDSGISAVSDYFSSFLRRTAHAHSTGKCAHNITDALIATLRASGQTQTANWLATHRPGNATAYNDPALMRRLGFVEIDPRTAVPQRMDIMLIREANPDGHITACTDPRGARRFEDAQWTSDFDQNTWHGLKHPGSITGVRYFRYVGPPQQPAPTTQVASKTPPVRAAIPHRHA